jgi:hypothetical protein
MERPSLREPASYYRQCIEDDDTHNYERKEGKHDPSYSQEYSDNLLHGTGFLTPPNYIFNR